MAYYRAGMVYYRSLNQATGIFNGTGLGDKKDAFKQDLTSSTRWRWALTRRSSAKPILRA